MCNPVQDLVHDFPYLALPDLSSFVLLSPLLGFVLAALDLSFLSY